MEKIINYGGQTIYPRQKNGNGGKWTYQCMKHAIRLYSPADKLVACLTNGVQASATELEPGRIWYSYGDVAGLSFGSFSEQYNAVREVFETLDYEGTYRGMMDWIYTRKTA